MARFKVIIIFIFIIFLFQCQGVASAEDVAELVKQGWKTIESKYFTIFCHPEVDIKRVNSKIAVRFYDVDWGRFSPKNKTVEEQLADKFDRIFRKVQRVLDMYPRKIHPKAKFFKNQAQLDKEYVRILGSSDGVKRISYYVHKHTTIYTTEQAIRAGILAHEMGHAVADHYFLIRPPEKIREMLSQYVELHLED